MRLSVAAVLAVVVVGAYANPLGPYKVDPSKVTTGGLSSGAFFAVQYHVAMSSTISGAAVFAGGPFYCAKGQETQALTTCMDPILSSPNAQELAGITRSLAESGKVDPVSNLADSNVYIYSGAYDTVVHRPVVTALESYYKIFVNGSGSVNTEYTIKSEHTFPTLAYGRTCSSLGAPYISKCLYDGAGAGLKVVYPSGLTKGSAVAGNLMTFDQTQFATGASLGTTGYIYVPTACKSGNTTCSLHINFHGCQQTLADIGTDYVAHTGLNDWAEGSNIIVVYPQVKKSDIIPANPEGCWDWWGYAGSDYAFKTGKQIKFASDILNAVQGISA